MHAMLRPPNVNRGCPFVITDGPRSGCQSVARDRGAGNPASYQKEASDSSMPSIIRTLRPDLSAAGRAPPLLFPIGRGPRGAQLPSCPPRCTDTAGERSF